MHANWYKILKFYTEAHALAGRYTEHTKKMANLIKAISVDDKLSEISAYNSLLSLIIRLPNKKSEIGISYYKDNMFEIRYEIDKNSSEILFIKEEFINQIIDIYIKNSEHLD
jgi:hypothetical protein